MRCPLKSPYFLITALYCPCPDTFPTDSASSLTCSWQTCSQEENWPALKWEESQHCSYKNSGYLPFIWCVPSFSMWKPGEVWASATSVSRAIVPALKITPPVAFRQITFPLHLGFNIFSEALVIPTWHRHQLGSSKVLFTKHFYFCISPVIRFSAQFPQVINSMQCYWET